MTRAVGLFALLGLACGDEVIGYRDPGSSGGDAASSDSGTTAAAEPSSGESAADGSSGPIADPMPDFVIGGYDLVHASSFDDGLTWEAFGDAPTGQSDLFAEGIVRGTDRILIVGSTTTLTSPDGRQWQSFSDNRGYQRSVTFGNDRFVSAGMAGRRTWSEDGMGWLDASAPEEYDFWNVGFGGGRFVVATGDRWFWSDDGATWTLGQEVDLGGAQVVVHGAGRFVIAGADTIAVSSDGTDLVFSRQNVPEWRASCWFRDRFVLMGYGVMWTSEDGMAWSEYEMSDYSGMGCSPTAVIAVNDAEVWRTEDLIDWELAATLDGDFTHAQYTGAP
jgi:hypothetical protein